MNLQHREEFEPVMALRCERALVTLLGDIGLWRKRVVLVGGLVPRYLVGPVPLGVSPHIGTTDVDLVIRLAVEQDFETYKTLATNLRDSGFAPDRDSYQWSRLVDGAKVILEFLCETDQVEAGKIHTTRQHTGSGFGAVNIPGAQLAARDFAEFEVEAERLDGGGMSKVTIQVAGILPFVVLKIRAFQERHYNKDSYDLIYTLLNYPNGGPVAAGRAAAASPTRRDELVLKSLDVLGQRFIDVAQDGPTAYANFLADRDDTEGRARRCNEAVAAVGLFLTNAGDR